MKLSVLAATLAMLSPASAFVPASTHQTTSALNAQMDRKSFIASAVGTIVIASPLIANAGTMGQERVNDPTEVWVIIVCFLHDCIQLRRLSFYSMYWHRLFLDHDDTCLSLICLFVVDDIFIILCVIIWMNNRWETGSPSATAQAARVARYANARSQMTSSFPPIKRLTLERKSPVTRLDINAPNFTAYKKTYPGLFKE